jgi:ribosomal protein S18 acetylase RimI-like enzyme
MSMSVSAKSGRGYIAPTTAIPWGIVQRETIANRGPESDNMTALWLRDGCATAALWPLDGRTMAAVTARREALRGDPGAGWSDMDHDDDGRPGLPGVIIRDMRPAEYQAVQCLWADAGLPFRPKGRDRPDKVAVEVQRGTAVFVVAEVEGELAGVVLGTHDGRKGWINRLAVAPAYRRRGIARLLVQEVEARLAELGMEITAALIETPNAASLAFFRAIGYSHDPEIEYVSKRRSCDT